MNGSYNVAEKVLDYWFTIDKLPPERKLFEKKAVAGGAEAERNSIMEKKAGI